MRRALGVLVTVTAIFGAAPAWAQSSGIAGVVTDIGENFVTVEVADNVRMRIQRGAIGNVLPKGTLKNA